MVERVFLTTEAALAQGLGSLEGLRAVDLGCGGGRVTRILAGMGARATGVEPNPTAVSGARAASAGDATLRFVEASAEATGLPAECADLAVFSMSLHHVPDKPAALAEALRLLRPGARLAVLEPVAPDPAWPVFRFIDDESAAYAAALEAMADLEARGAMRRIGGLQYAEKYHCADPATLVEHMVGVDPSRSLDRKDRAAFERAFRDALTDAPEGPFLTCWMRLDIFEATASAG